MYFFEFLKKITYYVVSFWITSFNIILYYIILYYIILYIFIYSIECGRYAFRLFVLPLASFLFQVLLLLLLNAYVYSIADNQGLAPHTHLHHAHGLRHTCMPKRSLVGVLQRQVCMAAQVMQVCAGDAGMRRWYDWNACGCVISHEKIRRGHTSMPLKIDLSSGNDACVYFNTHTPAISRLIFHRFQILLQCLHIWMYVRAYVCVNLCIDQPSLGYIRDIPDYACTMSVQVYMYRVACARLHVSVHGPTLSCLIFHGFNTVMYICICIFVHRFLVVIYGWGFPL